MPDASALSVNMELRSTPRLMLHLITMFDDSAIRSRLATMARWEYRIEKVCDWTRLDTWRLN